MFVVLIYLAFVILFLQQEVSATSEVAVDISGIVNIKVVNILEGIGEVENDESMWKSLRYIQWFVKDCTEFSSFNFCWGALPFNNLYIILLLPAPAPVSQYKEYISFISCNTYFSTIWI